MANIGHISTPRVIKIAEKGGWDKEARSQKPPMRFCMYCGKPFEPSSHKDNLCSDECRAKNRQGLKPIPPGAKKISHGYCKECLYYSPSGQLCDYYLTTGKRRNCPPDYCDKFDKRGNRAKPALSEDWGDVPIAKSHVRKRQPKKGNSEMIEPELMTPEEIEGMLSEEGEGVVVAKNATPEQM